MNKRIFKIALFILVIPLFTSNIKAAPAVSLNLTEEELNWLESHQRIYVGTMDAWPPFNFIESDGKPTGIGSDIVAALNMRLEGRLRIVPGAWKELYNKVKERRLDAIMDITPKQEREAFFNFTKPYLDVPHVIVAQRSTPYLENEDGLKGRVLALEKGFGNVNYFKQHYPEVTIREYRDTAYALDAVVRGEADAYAGNRGVAVYLINKELMTNLRIHGRLKKSRSILAVGTRKDWPILTGILQKTLDDIGQEEYLAILDKWVSLDEKQRPWWYLSNEQIVALITGLAALIMAFILAWNIYLRRLVQAQSANLAENEAKLRGLYELSPLGIALTDLKGRYLEFNESFRRICGYTEKELKALDYWELTPRKYEAEEARQLESLTRTGRYGPYEKEYMRSDGDLVPLRLNGVLMEGKGGQKYIWSIVEDISERKEIEERAIRLGRIVERSLNEIYIFDAKTLKFIEANDGARFNLGYSIEELCELTPVDIKPDFALEHFEEQLQPLRTGERDISIFETVHMRKDGTLYNVEIHLQLMRDESPQVFVAIVQDITERKLAEEELRISAIAFESQEGMLVTDANAVIIRVNQAFTRLTGYLPEEVIGKRPSVLSSGRHGSEFYKRMWQLLKKRGYWQGEIWNRRKDGKVYAEWLTISAVVAPDGTKTHFVGTFTDITVNEEAEAEIHRLAYYDPLTQLPNRRLLQDRLEQAILSTRRSGHHGALLFLDLDDFKKLNDTRGHETGDQLLVETAQRMKDCVREGDTVARQGGDEFVIILEGLGEKRQDAALQVEQVAEKVRTALAQPYDLSGTNFHCTTSIGIALLHDHNTTAEMLLKHADMALYKAKDAGRNCFQFFDPAMQIALEKHTALETELRIAVEHEQLMLHYQVQVDVNRKVIGAEVLLRWQRADQGLIPPDKFIPLAEETGLIIPIGQWVLETVCTQLKTWATNPDLSQLRLAINVSARQFHQTEFVSQVEEVLSQTGANPERLKIELTESMVLEDIDDTFEKMHALKAMGIALSLDDFGTGYSSLSYLTRLPLDQLKIDRSFVLDLPDNQDDVIVAQTIIAMARGLGLDVIAEGVETEAQREFLRHHGCHSYQGYLFSRPLPLDDFEMLTQRNS